MPVSRQVELQGHIVDSGTMQAAFEIVMDMRGSFEVEEFTIGRHETEESYARLFVEGDDEDLLNSIVHDSTRTGRTPSTRSTRP